MSNNGVAFDKICRFCGYEKNIGKFIFSSEAVKNGLLSKIKQLFPEEVKFTTCYIILSNGLLISCNPLLLPDRTNQH